MRAPYEVHYLVAAGSDGPIPTAIGHRMVACEPNRATLPEAATGWRPAVTCPKCRATAMFAEDERDNTDNHFEGFASLLGLPKGE